MKAFEYVAPTTVESAVSLLGNQWGKTEILAGGTDLITSMKQGLTSPDRVVSLKHLGLSGIRLDSDKGTVRIGAMTPMGTLTSDETITQHFPALTRAVSNLGSPQMLSTGTVGGDLCQRPRCWYFRNGMGLLAQQDGQSLVEAGDNRYHAIFGNQGAAKFVSASSLGPPLIALGATIVTSARRVPASAFFATPKAENERETVLKPNEIATAVELPLSRLKNATYEVRHRRGLDWPYVSASVAFGDKGGNASVVLGHVAPTPWVASAAASALSGAAVSSEVAAKCGAAAAQGAAPLSKNGYKAKMVQTAVKRAVLIAAGLRAEG